MKEQAKEQFLLKHFVNRLLIGWGAVTIIIIIQMISAMSFYNEIKGSSLVTVIFKMPYLLGAVLILMMGIRLSHHYYGGFISICAERKRFLCSCIGIGLIASNIFYWGIYLITLGASKLMHILLPEATIQNGIWQKEGVEEGLQLVTSNGFIDLLGWSVLLFFLGFLVGALFYRLSHLTALCLISFLPILLVLSIVSQSLFNNSASTVFMMAMFFIFRPMLSLAGQIIYGLLFLGMSYFLLVKAPIPTYAHDLL